MSASSPPPPDLPPEEHTLILVPVFSCLLGFWFCCSCCLCVRCMHCGEEVLRKWRRSCIAYTVLSTSLSAALFGLLLHPMGDSRDIPVVEWGGIGTLAGFCVAVVMGIIVSNRNADEFVARRGAAQAAQAAAAPPPPPPQEQQLGLPPRAIATAIGVAVVPSEVMPAVLGEAVGTPPARDAHHATPTLVEICHVLRRELTLPEAALSEATHNVAQTVDAACALLGVAKDEGSLVERAERCWRLVGGRPEEC